MGIRHLLGMHSLSKIGSARLYALMEYFGEYQAAWDNFDMWPEVLGTGIDYAALKREWKHTDLAALYEKFLLSDAKLLTVDDPMYPRRLRGIPDAPYAMFYRGELPPDDDMVVAIVGSRRATAYGREAASYFANGLARSGAWVVGGMARGIDSAAHQAALDAGGKTVGILGCGIDVVYPPENAALYEEAAQRGCLISEYPMGMKPLGRNFPMRNRVISGLADAVLVVEAGAKSGTQITVDYAGVQGRRIYAVPGSIFSQFSAGTIALIRSGKAAIASSAQDILEDLAADRGESKSRATGKRNAVSVADKAERPGAAKQLAFNTAGQMELADIDAERERRAAAKPVAKPLPAGEKERRVVEFVTEQKHFNDISRELGIAAPELAGLLTLMEIDGFIKRLDGQYYIRSQV